MSQITFPQDMKQYEEAFSNAIKIHTTEPVMKNEFQKLSLADLEKLKDYLKHDKTTLDKKLMKLHEYHPTFESINTVSTKLSAAIEVLESNVERAIRTEFVSQSGEFSMRELVNFIDITIGIKKAQNDAPMG